MLRRKMFSYAVLFSIGITTAYFILERSEYFLGTVFFIAIIFALRSFLIDSFSKNPNHEARILLTFLIIGVLCFTVNFFYMNGKLTDGRGRIVNYSDISSVSGRVESINKNDNGYKIVIKVNSVKEMRKLQASYYQALPDNHEIQDLIGSTITLYGTIKKPAAGENPGCFNYKLYLNSRRIRYTMSAKLLRIDKENDSLRYCLKRILFSTRERFISIFCNDAQGILRGIIFGDKSELDDDTIYEFNINSTGHILAVSGLHVGFLFVLLKMILKKRTKVACFIILFTLLIYGEMTMWSPSTTRAIIVMAISMFRIYSVRPFDLLSSVSTAAIVILVCNPYQLFNSGFQMSFLALLGISFLTTPFSFFVGESMAVILAVQTAITPMIMYSFNAINIMSIFVNIPIVFLASVLVPLTIISLIFMIISGGIPTIIIKIIEGLSGIIVDLNRWLCFDGLFYNNIPGISVTILILFYAILFYIFSEWTRVRLLRNNYMEIIKKIPLIITPFICLSVITFNSFASDEVIFISVGQGDSCHIRAANQDVLIDGGGNSNYNIGRNVLRQYLLKSGAEKVDVVLLTHLHKDHYLGIYELNEVYPIGKIGVSSAYIRTGRTSIDKASKYNTAPYSDNAGALELPENVFAIEAGDRVNLDKNVYIEPIWPVSRITKSLSINDANENNMVYMIYYGNYKILITGDMLEKDELEMVEYYRGSEVLKADVLKVCHHGSKSSTSDAFLDAVKPTIAVISVGENNMYGHPSQQTLDRLNDRGIKTYRTDIDGAIGLDIGEETIHIDTMKRNSMVQ